MGQPNPSRETKFFGANRDREMFIFPVQLTTTSRNGSQPYPVDPFSATVYVMTIHITYTTLLGFNR